jgi:hypothetical protein
MIFNGDTRSPSPVYEGTPSIWHLAEILTWLREDKMYSVGDSLLEVAITYGRLRQRQHGV